MNGMQLFLKPDEQKFLAMSVLSQREQIEKSLKNEKINWNPEARKLLKEMKAAGDSLYLKLVKLGFHMGSLPDFEPGDETEFLTKES